jgi:hypothetical protein
VSRESPRDGDDRTFRPGQVVVHRNVRQGCIGWIRPARVVGHDERGLLLWIAPGTTIAYEVTADGRGMRSMPFDEWSTCSHRLAEGTWTGGGTLMLLPEGAAHSVWWQYAEDGRFTQWYVNLEEPAVRWEDDGLAGVDIVDQDLDLVVRPDRTWEWKDEEELAERLAHPAHYWVTDEAAVRAEGERVLSLVNRGRFPFDGTWCDFRPDPGWPVPTDLPPGCRRPPV